jgi:hypothetical protein
MFGTLVVVVVMVAAAVGGNIGIGSTVGSSNDDGVDIDCYE